MRNNIQKKIGNGLIYLDVLNFSSVFSLIWSKDITHVISLEKLGLMQNILSIALYLKGISVTEASFFSGDLKLSDNQSVMLKAQTLAGEISFSAAEQVVHSESVLKKYNKLYGRNTIQLFIAKQLYYYIAYWTIRAMVAHVLSDGVCTEVWLKKPYQLNSQLIVDKLPEINVKFYSARIPFFYNLIKILLLDFVRDMRLITRGRRKKNYKEGFGFSVKPSVLMMQEDNIHADLSLRGQPHWLDLSKPNDLFDTYILELLSYKVSKIKDRELLKQANIETISTSIFRFALKCMKKNDKIRQLRKNRYSIYLAALISGNYSSTFYLLRVAALLRHAELMGAAALLLKSKVFLVRETYSCFSDAMMLIAPKINITTIAYQYSNMNIITPFMMTTADKFLIFSDLYKSVFQTDHIKPREFISVGYLYDGVSEFVRKKAIIHQKSLRQAGANFIVCYFDETVQHDRWGLVSKDDHLRELHTLAQCVLDDQSFGVVVKSQFMFNSPSKLYPDDKLLKKAIQTGRYLELKEGFHRNDIYPSEAALIADLCISHKFGATAALEAAIAGVKTVLLDSYGVKTLFDSIYCKADIEYKNIDLLMRAIANYRQGDISSKNLGDWSNIIHYFDSYLDGNAAVRLRKEVVTCINDTLS